MGAGTCELFCPPSHPLPCVEQHHCFLGGDQARAKLPKAALQSKAAEVCTPTTAEQPAAAAEQARQTSQSTCTCQIRSSFNEESNCRSSICSALDVFRKHLLPKHRSKSSVLAWPVLGIGEVTRIRLLPKDVRLHPMDAVLHAKTHLNIHCWKVKSSQNLSVFNHFSNHFISWLAIVNRFQLPGEASSDLAGR